MCLRRAFLGFVLVCFSLCVNVPVIRAAKVSTPIDENRDGYADSEFTAIQTFLNAPSAVSKCSNGQRLSSLYDPDDPQTWFGISWSDGDVRRVLYIGRDGSWQNRLLAGDLKLCGFSKIAYLDCSKNRLKALDTSGCTALTYLNCEENRLSSLLIGSKQLEFLQSDKNQLMSVKAVILDSDISLQCDESGFVGLNCKGGVIQAVTQPDTEFDFVCWMASGQTVSKEEAFLLSAGTEYDLIANFKSVLENVNTITVLCDNQKYGTVLGGGKIEDGQRAVVRAIPKAGCAFIKWTEHDTVVSTDAEYAFIVSSDRTLKAWFSTIGTPLTSVSALDYRSIQITWNPVPGAKGYEIYRSVKNTRGYRLISSVQDSLSFRETRLISGRTYYYKVRAYVELDSGRYRGRFSSVKRATPKWPSISLSASKTGFNAVSLRWNAVICAQWYDVYRSTSSKGSFSPVAQNLPDPSFTDTVPCGSTYYYKIRSCAAVDGVIYKSPWSNCVKISTALPAPVVLANSESTGIRLGWKPVEGASGYELYRSKFLNRGYEKIAATTETEYVCSGLTGGTYYIKVRAYRKESEKKFYSAYSKAVEIVTDTSDGIAIDITNQCGFLAYSTDTPFSNAIDGNYATVWKCENADSQYIEITVPSEHTIGGIYFVWNVAPKSWELSALDESGDAKASQSGGKQRYLTQFVPIQDSLERFDRFRLSFSADPGCNVEIADLSVFTKGKPPYYAPMWQPFSGKVDLMTIAAHPDDEDLYLGLPAAIYGNEGKKCVTVFMSSGGSATSVRRYEGQESAWSLGNKQYPVMRYVKDVRTSTLEEAEQNWPLDDTVSYIVEQIRKYKPSVIVTHDASGEYGHGAHMLTSYATQLAFVKAGDPTQYPESAKKNGTWNAGKLYAHLYNVNPLDPLNLQKKLNSYGNRTAYQVVADAYARHKSQLPGRSLPTDGTYDMRRFGLCLSNLGEDRVHSSMFENVSDDSMSALNP